MFHRIYYDDRSRTLDELIGKSKFDKFAGTYVKIVVSHKTNPFFFDKFLEQVYLAQPADVSIAENFNNNLDSDEKVDLAEDTLTILSKYVDGMDLDIDKGRLKDNLRNLYIEATNMERSND